ncbi:MAG: peptidase T [Oscillospiraceae bacterium]|jgi:tripeptide aminopeptidase|nr:peptidase T [Oscillospiraceae bacterium]
MTVTDRFLNYVRIHSASDDKNDSEVPSAKREFDMTDHLYSEMKELGFSGVYRDEHAYVYGFIPASEGMEKEKCIAFNAHIDTIPDFPGENVRPQITYDYDGNDVLLGSSGRVLSADMFPHLRSLKGQTLITTDGTTVLGADDKAGIAEIMSACEFLLKHSDIKHGKISVCFSPDEEIGHGAALMDLDRVGADYGYTVDGGEVNEINFETFNASSAKVFIKGVSVHPGSAKDKMVNASLVAMEFNSLLPPDEIPSKTENYEGFFHLTEMSGSTDSAELSYIIRDHDSDRFKEREDMICSAADEINSRYGKGTAKVEIKEQYRNMSEVIGRDSEPVKRAEKAIEKAGIEAVYVPVRGGTDGAQLSFRGLPCPNLGTGGYGFHGPYEHITSEHLEKMTEILINIMT